MKALVGIKIAFGKVVNGMDIINKIGSVPTGAMDRPNEPVVMNKVTIKR